MKYIYSHMGLGDHIICNGLYRELIQSNQQYSLFVKSIIKNQIYDNWKGLPILQVDDYSELTNELMDSFLNQEFSNDLLYMDYWKKIIRNQI